jgi:hypothetical protein
MRIVEVVQIVGTMFGAVATVVAAVGSWTVARFKRAGAVSESTAIDVPDGRLLRRWWLSRLTARGVLRTVDPGRMYLDVARYREYRATRRKRALMVVGIVLVVTVGVILVLGGAP